MKKLVSLLAVLMLVFGMSACELTDTLDTSSVDTAEENIVPISSSSESDISSVTEQSKAEEKPIVPSKTAGTTSRKGVQPKPVVSSKPAVSTPPPATATSAPNKTENPQSNTYILSRNTQKFHLPSCGYVDRIKEENKGTFSGNRNELIQQGYEPCGKCNP